VHTEGPATAEFKVDWNGSFRPGVMENPGRFPDRLISAVSANMDFGRTQRPRFNRRSGR